jgi:hypothetical protein
MIVAIIVIILIGLCIVGIRITEQTDTKIILILSGFLLSLLIICPLYTDKKYDINAMNESKIAIYSEINYYKNTGVLNPGLVDKIEDYNTRLFDNKRKQRNIFIEYMTPTIYDEYEYIEFKVQ